MQDVRAFLGPTGYLHLSIHVTALLKSLDDLELDINTLIDEESNQPYDIQSTVRYDVLLSIFSH